MKNISNAALARSASPAQRVAWLLELAHGGWSWRGATLQISLGGEAWPARLAATPAWREELPPSTASAPLPGGLARSRAEVRVADFPDATDSLRARLAVTPPVGILATLRLAWLDATLAGDAADSAVMLHGRVLAWRVEPAGVVLDLADELSAIGARPVGRLLHAAMLGNHASPAIGRPLPWLFGGHGDAELVPLRVGACSRLAGDLSPAAPVIPLASLEGFPAFGRVRVNSEIIEYSRVNPTSRTLGVGAEHVTRARPQSHPRGSLVRLVPPSGHQWLVADHPCHAVDALYADGVPLDPSAWVASEGLLDGHAVQVVALADWPLNADGRPARRVSAAVRGLADAAGNLMENPVDVVELLLTHPRLGVVAPGELDAESFGAARAACAARRMRFARRLHGGESLAALLDSALRECGAWLVPGRPLRLALCHPVPRAAEASLALGHRDALLPGRPAQIAAPLEGLVPDSIELTGSRMAAAPGAPFAISRRFPPEREGAGLIPRRIATHWLDLASHPASGDLGERAWARLGDSPFHHAQDYALGLALRSVGDTARLDHHALDLRDALAWISAIDVAASDAPASRSPARARLSFVGPWVNEYCWKFDHLNYVRQMAFGALTQFVLAGRPVASLGRSGALRIAGRLRESVSFPAVSFAESIAYSDGALWFGVGNPGSCQAFMRLDASGNVELDGALRERSPLSAAAPLPCHAADAATFAISTDSHAWALRYQRASRTLELPGILVEDVAL